MDSAFFNPYSQGFGSAKVKVANVQKGLLWRQAPPAVFPVCLGVMGLGLAWRKASEILPVANQIGDLILGFATAYFLWFLALYLVKTLSRPKVVLEDLVLAPARAGIAAAAMCMMLLAAALMPLGIAVAQVWWCGVLLQIAASAAVCWAIWQEAPALRQFSPFQYLSFVGPVVGPIAGVPLGYVTESLLLTLAAFGAFVVITLGYGRRLLQAPLAVKMRPALVIFLSPNCLFAISFALLGFETGFWVFYWLSSLVALGFVLSATWLTQGGWSPAWASFTFPVTAFVQVQIIAVQMGAGAPAMAGVFVGLALATPLVLIIAFRFTVEWITGELAEKTEAAIA